MFDEKILKEVYSFEGTNQSLVINQITQEVFLKKELDIYNRCVYEYLMDNSNIHIPKIFEVKENDGILTVYEEYINGVTLEDILLNGKPSEKYALYIIDGILDGLSFLHSANPKIIHRDIKPSNIMITNDGIVKIIDYNAAKFLNENEDKDTILIGTNGSAAPEQYGFMPSTEKTDIFAVGKLMEKLFPNDKYYFRIVAKSTAMNPDDRYRNINELRRAVFGESRNEQKNHLKRKNSFERILDHIPGFRSRTLWKGVIATFCDSLFIYFLCDTDFQYSKAEALAIKIFFILSYLLTLDICFDITGLFKNFPGKKSKSILIKTFSRMIWSVIFIVVALFFFLLLIKYIIK